MFDQLDRAILGPLCFHFLRRHQILEIDDRKYMIARFKNFIIMGESTFFPLQK